MCPIYKIDHRNFCIKGVILKNMFVSDISPIVSHVIINVEGKLSSLMGY